MCDVIFQIEDIVSEDENGLKVDLTHIYGGFSEFTLDKLSEVFAVDISGCTTLNPCEFVEGLMGCIDLEKLVMVGCHQFSEYNIVDVCTSVPYLKYFDARKCSGLQYANANVILCNVRKLKVFKVEIKYPEYERNDWQKLKLRFPDVYFGEEVEELLQSK